MHAMLPLALFMVFCICVVDAGCLLCSISVPHACARACAFARPAVNDLRMDMKKRAKKNTGKQTPKKKPQVQRKVTKSPIKKPDSYVLKNGDLLRLVDFRRLSTKHEQK